MLIIFFGLTIENSPYMLKIDDWVRFNQFIACKFEIGHPDSLPLHSPIQISVSANENDFIGCQFVYTEDAIPYMFTILNDKTK